MENDYLRKLYYVYRITNTQENKHYYGSRSTNITPKEDLGVVYFSSSSDKNFINEQKNNNRLFRYKIIRIYNTKHEAINMEIKLHKYFNVKDNKNFYNLSNQTSVGFSLSEESKLKIKETKSKIGDDGLTSHQRQGLTSKTTILENGLSIAQHRAIKSVKSRATVLENGLTLGQVSATKSVKTKKTTMIGDKSVFDLSVEKQKQTKNSIEENGLTKAKNSGKKGKETRLTTIEENGKSIAKNCGEKGGKTKTKTILDNGKSIAQNSAYKGIQTLNNKILENGMKATEHKANKISETKKGCKCINNGTINKIVKPSELEYYIENGWLIGYLKK